MQTKQITINNKTYTLHIAYQNQEQLRKAFNTMTFDFWEFTFESYYQSGYWNDTCVIFSLFEGETIVAHTTLSLFTTKTPNKELYLGQLGTVMTQPTHTQQGLSRFLMEYIFDAYRGQLDGYFLFANNTVLDFYPKFGFSKVPEFQATKMLEKQPSDYQVQRLDLNANQDLQLFQHYITKGKTACRFDTQNYGLAHFYCYANPAFGFSDSIYVIPELKTLLIAQQEEGNLLIFQAYYLDQNQLDKAFHALATENTTRITLGYTPISGDYTFVPYKEEDLTLFVTSTLVPFFTAQQTMISLLSHT
ncbi:GNAT family N-acetyltransferase [Myroides fluvii]|uniref:GNAT family N-acetyltransferase n=1 Tax=Myroides fluvii TaxID=2572594 RepID=UPI00131ADD6D|nr:GNAT family N-acetyltransferase [Myroides fluvii]